MIVGYHVVWSAYGFWLPNDPRGSWSEFVGSWELFRTGGPATKTTETRSLARNRHDRAERLAVKELLQRAPVAFTGLQARAVARGFAGYVERSGLPVWACAILPDHVHLVIGRSELTIENVVIQLKRYATNRLVEEGIHPFQNLKPVDGPPPKCWAQGCWKVFLDPPDVERSIRYVEQNPVKDGLRPQKWKFVSPVSREATPSVELPPTPRVSREAKPSAGPPPAQSSPPG